MNVHGLTIGLILGTVLLFPMQEAVLQCLPVDEAAQRPDFYAFRARLLEAAAERDSATVLAAVAPTIHFTFGPGSGINDFKKEWRLPSRDSKFFVELTKVFALGGYFEGENAFVAPYTFRCGGRDEDNAVIVGASVNVRSAPVATAPSLGTLSFSYLKRTYDGDRPGWTAIEYDGRRAYVSAPYVRNLLDYRAWISKVNGTWTITAFIAGD